MIKDQFETGRILAWIAGYQVAEYDRDKGADHAVTEFERYFKDELEQETPQPDNVVHFDSKVFYKVPLNNATGDALDQCITPGVMLTNTNNRLIVIISTFANNSCKFIDMITGVREQMSILSFRENWFVLNPVDID